MEAIKIILLCIAAAVSYGILQDQVTARVCVEYFTVGHPPIILTTDPTLLAFAWGIAATWWVGVLLGVPAAFAARARPIVGLMVFVGCSGVKREMRASSPLCKVYI